MRAVDYAADAAVDYGPVGPVDYDAAHLWISGLGEERGGDVGAGFAPTPLRQD